MPRNLTQLQNAASRTTLFDRLATLERAGIPLLDALQTLTGQGKIPQLGRTISHLRNGTELAEAGRLGGLWRPWEVPVIAAGQSAGRLAEALQRLAEHYRRQTRRWQRLRGRLLLPALSLLIGVVVGPLPALVGGSIGAVGYAVRVVIPLVVLAVIADLLRQAYQGALGADQVDLVRQFRQRDRIATLALLMESNLPPTEALQLLARSASEQTVRHDLERAAQALEAGQSFTTTLESCGLLDDPVGQQLLQSGEDAGRLPEMLGRYRNRLDEALDSRLDTITGVLPWIIYGLVIAWVFL